MGSFSSTCAISGLPLEAGDKVRAYLLTENPYDDSIACYSTAFWFPRTFPIRAEYNDYGSIDEVEDGPAKDLWMEGLQIDLIERGMGDNVCHDVLTTRTMSFDDLLTALWERRVLVQRNVDRSPIPGMPKPKTPKGVATMARVRKLLVAAGEKIQTKGFSGPGWFVSNRARGQVCVRWADYTDKLKNFERAKKIIEKHYPCVIGFSHRDQSPELYVFTRTDTENFYPARKDSKKPLRVEMAMVREDVWLSMATMEVPRTFKFDRPIAVLDDFKKAVRISYDNARPKKAYFENLDEEVKDLFNRFEMRHAVENKDRELFERMGGFYIRDAVPFTVAWEKHFELLTNKNLTDDVVFPILDSVAEMMRIAHITTQTRNYWKPSYSIGPQFGEWAAHAAYHKQMAAVAEAGLQARRENMGYDDDDSESDES